MSEHIDYQIYEKRLLLTRSPYPSTLTERTENIWEPGISDGPGLILGLMLPKASLKFTMSD